jgi:Tol biopolymer transport system component
MLKRKPVLAALSILSLAIILGCGGGGGGVASVPTKLMISSNESGAFYQAHTINLDGSSPTQLTFESPSKINPIAIEEGAKVVYMANFSNHFDIYMTDPETNISTNLTNNPAQDRLQDIHEGTGKILFTSNRDGNEELFTMGIDGSNVTQITSLDYSTISDAQFSKDGTKIVYLGRSGDWYMRVCNADGSNNLAISGNDGSYSKVKISPDGTKVAYEFYNTTTNDFSIGIRNINGTNSRILIDDAFEDLLPNWSPDGSKIVFARQDISNNRNIMMANADGTGLTTLTNDTLFNDLPVFSLDGSKIIFVIGDTSDTDLATINTDGTGKTIIHNTDRSINSIRPY